MNTIFSKYITTSIKKQYLAYYYNDSWKIKFCDIDQRWERYHFKINVYTLADFKILYIKGKNTHENKNK
jgi:hypothetical protein